MILMIDVHVFSNSNCVTTNIICNNLRHLSVPVYSNPICLEFVCISWVKASNNNEGICCVRCLDNALRVGQSSGSMKFSSTLEYDGHVIGLSSGSTDG